jgi:hypothetical protein
VLAASLFGDRTAAEVHHELVRFCERELHAAPADLRFFRMSVGAVFGLVLDDGREVVVKLHLPREPLERLRAVQRVQRHLSDGGFPCPPPIGAPAPLLDRHATLEELVAGGEERDAHDPAVRRVMAQTLARLIRLTDGLERPDALDAGWRLAAPDRLWPEPHNALFDFEATAAGAEWIDRLAERARDRMGAGRTAVGHTDWSVKHFRFRGERVHVIYDWDSLRLEREPMLVAGAAVHFPYTEAFDVPRVASLGELVAFVDEYEEERATPLSPEERAAVYAHAVYGLGYTARCEHARDPDGAGFAGSYREALAEFGEQLLA